MSSNDVDEALLRCRQHLLILKEPSIDAGDLSYIQGHGAARKIHAFSSIHLQVRES
jgi:hypothetical protein